MLPIDAGVKAAQVQDSYLNQDALNSLKSMGRDKDPQALREVAKKFEAMFVQQMLKTMREANEVFAEDSYFNSNESRFHRDMLDQQMVLNLTSGRGIGLADQFYRQMLQNYGAAPTTDAEMAPAVNDTDSLGDLGSVLVHQNFAAQNLVPQNSMSALFGADENQQESERYSESVNLAMLMRNNNPQLSKAVTLPRSSTAIGVKADIADSPENFVELLKPHAQKAAAELQLDPEVLIAQVALETGWGKHVIHSRSGENSFNLFNIKSGRGWQGDKVKVSTLEYRQGVTAPEQAEFRKYQSYAESFADYVSLIKDNPRYERARAAQGNSRTYADELQAAGYATDPHYAQKIKTLLGSAALRAAAVGQDMLDLPAAARSVAQHTRQKLGE